MKDCSVSLSRFNSLTKYESNMKFPKFKSTITFKVLATIVLSGVISVFFSAATVAQEKATEITTGIWLTGNDGSKIETYQKDGLWFGKLVASDNENAPLGTEVLRNFSLKDGVWQGEVYSIKRDQLANATIAPSDEALTIEISIAFFSKTLTWKKEEVSS